MTGKNNNVDMNRITLERWTYELKARASSRVPVGAPKIKIMTISKSAGESRSLSKALSYKAAGVNTALAEHWALATF